MSMIRIVIPGNPIAKNRPRFAKRGKFVQTYNDQETEEGKFIAQVLAQAKGQRVEGPLHLELHCLKSRPKYHFGTGRNSRKLKSSAPRLPANKPDLDNYIKFVMDCLNEILFKDDAQIVEIMSTKRYSEDPATVIVLTEIKV